jgi:hypothetical protein
MSHHDACALAHWDRCSMLAERFDETIGGDEVAAGALYALIIRSAPRSVQRSMMRFCIDIDSLRGAPRVVH